MYKTKYIIEYKDDNEIDTRIELQPKGYTGSPVDLEASGDPLIIELKSRDTKFTPCVCSSGANINTYSPNDMQLLDLFTIDTKGVRTLIYKANKLFWCGFLASELYEEDYSNSENYPVSVTANDGFNILDRYNYDNINSTPTIWSVVTGIIGGLDLPYDKLFVNIKHEFKGGTGIWGPDETETVLHKVKVMRNNYYDEDKEPLTQLQVLEAILQPFGLICFQSLGSIYILDVTQLHNKNIDFKVYDCQTFEYVEDVSINKHIDLDISTTLKWYRTGQSISKVGGINKQAVTYSAMTKGTALNIEDWKDENNRGDVGNWVLVDRGDKSYYVLEGATPKAWKLTSPSILTGQKTIEDKGEGDVYISWVNTKTGGVGWPWEKNGNVLASYTGDTTVVTMDNEKLLLKFKLYIRTSNHVRDKEKLNTIKGLGLGVYVKINNAYLIGGDTVGTPQLVFVRPKDFATGNTYPEYQDKWVDFNALLDLGDFYSATGTGPVTIEISDHFLIMDGGGSVSYNDDRGIVEEFRVKDIEVVPIDSYNESINTDDIQYIGYLNPSLKEEGSEITLYHNSDTKGHCTDQGTLLMTNKHAIESWRKSDYPEDLYIPLAETLLKAVIGNYNNSLVQLHGCLTNHYTKLNQLYTIGQTTKIGNRVLMLTEGEYNDRECSLSGTWIEVLPDNEPIKHV